MKKLTLLGMILTCLLGLALWQQQRFVAKAAPMFNTLTVINTSDSGPGSLRQAIADGASGDTIVFDATVFATPQTINLTSGELTLDKSLTIDGPGANQLTINANGTSRVFMIPSLVALELNIVALEGLTIAGGNGVAGGGIHQGFGTLTITNVSVIGNNATISGGGIYIRDGTLTVINSTIASNTGSSNAGVYNQFGTMTLTNSTVSDNFANTNGGGLANGGILTVTNSTISNNAALTSGGGIFSSGTETLNNTIVAGNLTGPGPSDIVGTIEVANNNLIGNAGSSGGIANGVNGNKVGNAGVGTLNINTIIEITLENNGGPTQTHRLMPLSPAIDAGSNALAAGLTTDQRGIGFPRTIGSAVDIGSYEAACPMLVTNTNDSGAGSLRQTIAEACPNATITFDTAGAFSTPQTILLTTGELVINKSLQIQGPGASQVTVSGNHASRVFLIDYNNIVTLDGLTVTGGNGASTVDSGTGGGIDNNGTLTITNSTVSGNSGGSGGGIGGIGTLTLINCTVSGNSGDKGGGIGSFGTARLINCTVTGNSASIAGGGVFDIGLGGGTTANNTIIAGNTRNDGTTPDDILGPLGSIFRPANNNLIGDAATSGGIANGVNGNIVGNGGAGTIDINTVLNTTLANNGGPTLTHALVPGSPALNAGTNALALDAANQPLTTDQRGTGFPRIIGGTVDIGAYEDAFNTTPTITGATIASQAGSPASSSQIATVNDVEDDEDTLTVTATPLSGSGVTLSGISVDSSGNVTANVVASCNASNSTFTLRVTDNGNLFAEATLDVSVTSNPVPVLGTYPTTNVAGGASTTVTPDAVPTDNGTVATLTAAAPGFTGTFSGNPATGVITVTNANPPGSYSVTVTATDNCGATSTATFTLNVNNPPTITGATTSRQQGSAASSSPIATVNDLDQAENTLVVTVNSGASATVNGVTVSGISVDTSGNVTASVAASCTATNATFTLTVTDGNGATATATLNVTVNANTPPTLGTYSATTVTTGGSTTVTPSAAPADNGSISSRSVAAPGFTGTLSVNPAGVVSIGNAGPAGNYVVTVTLTDNCGVQTTRTFNLSVTTLFNFVGFFQPVDNAPTVNRVNAGQAIPVKFSLGGNQGLAIFAAGYPASQPISCNSGNPTDVIEETVTAGGSSLSYDATTGQYKYTWKTEKAWKGTCRKLVLTFSDGSVRFALFQFK